MVMGCVFFEVRTEYLDIINTSFGFEGLNKEPHVMCSLRTQPIN
jgi:hypothetical protein